MEKEKIISSETSASPFFSLKVGDTVTAYDAYSRDCAAHRVKIESIEYNKENATPENPKGMTCYGTDLDEDQWGDDYVTVVTHANFIQRFKTVELDNELPVTVYDITNEDYYKTPRITYLDGLEEECWNLFKEYAEMVGAAVDEKDEDNFGPSYCIAKEIQEKIIEMVEDVFGVPFPMSKEG